MSSRGHLRGRWTREVYRTTTVTDSVKVILLALTEVMREDGYVSVSRATLADQLGKSPRRVQERLEMAVRAGLLDRVVTGKPGVTAVYRAMLPIGRTERITSPSSKPLSRLLVGADDRPIESRSVGADDRPTTTDSDGAHDRPISMGRNLVTTGERTTAPSGHAQHGADDRPANSEHAGTAAGRAACPGDTTELRNDREDHEDRPRLRAVGGDAA